MSIQDFIPKLKGHISSRLSHPNEYVEDEPSSAEERGKIHFVNDRIYAHRTIQVNYTTYDMRLGQDSINPRTHSDVMTLKRHDSDSHPFAYARILGIFHVRVKTDDHPVPVNMEILWVRWFSFDSRYRSGRWLKRLPRLEFLPGLDSDAFGFLDPDEVIRGSHVIPAFAYGCTNQFLQRHSIARQCFHMNVLDPAFTWPDEPDEDDYRYYYVNM